MRIPSFIRLGPGKNASARLLYEVVAIQGENIFRHGDVPAGTIRGYQPGLHVSIAAWSRLCRFRPEILPRIRQIVKTAMSEGNPLFDDREGWGIRLLTEVVRAEREIQDQEPLTT